MVLYQAFPFRNRRYTGNRINGAFTSLYSFTERFDWSELVNNIAGGINTFVSEFDWKANGRKLEAFLDNLCGS